MTDLIIPIVLIILFILAIIAEIIYYNKSYNVILSFEEGFKRIKLPVVEIKSGDTILTFLVDSGSQASYIDKNIITHIDANCDPNTQGTVVGINKTTCQTTLCIVSLQAMGQMFSFPMQTFDFNEAIPSEEDLTGGIVLSGVLGSDFLQKYNGIIDYKHKIVKLCQKTK